MPAHTIIIVDGKIVDPNYGAQHVDALLEEIDTEIQQSNEQLKQAIDVAIKNKLDNKWFVSI